MQNTKVMFGRLVREQEFTIDSWTLEPVRVQALFFFFCFPTDLVSHKLEIFLNNECYLMFSFTLAMEKDPSFDSLTLEQPEVIFLGCHIHSETYTWCVCRCTNWSTKKFRNILCLKGKSAWRCSMWLIAWHMLFSMSTHFFLHFNNWNSRGHTGYWEFSLLNTILEQLQHYRHISQNILDPS